MPQANYRWLCDGKNEIEKDDRQELIRSFKVLVYAETKDDFDEKKIEIELEDKYPSWLHHLQVAYFDREEAWAMFYRKEQNLPTHNTHTNNYVETSFLDTKEHQFHRQKCYNTPELLSIMMDKSEPYKQKLIELGCNRTTVLRYNNSRYNYISSSIQNKNIIDLGEGNYIVESETNKNKQYKVNMKSGFCQCPVGKSCGPCKHKSAIAKCKGVAGLSVIPENDPYMRAFWHYVALGAIQPEWMYRGDNDDEDTNLNLNEFIELKIRESKECEDGEDRNDLSNNHCESNDETDSKKEDDQDDQDYEELIEDFSKMWTLYGERIVTEFRKNPSTDWEKATQSALRKLNKYRSFTPMSLKDHLHWFGTEKKGNKEKGKRRLVMNVQPAALRRSRENGTKRRGRGSLIGASRFKDRSGEKLIFVLEDGEEMELPGLQKIKKRKNVQTHDIKKAIDQKKTVARRHTRQP